MKPEKKRKPAKRTRPPNIGVTVMPRAAASGNWSGDSSAYRPGAVSILWEEHLSRKDGSFGAMAGLTIYIIALSSFCIWIAGLIK